MPHLEVSAFDSVGLHQEAVCQGGLPVIDVSDDGEVPDVTREHLQQAKQQSSPAASLAEQSIIT